MAVEISRVEVMRPPGVSSSTTSAAACAWSAAWMASAMNSAETGWTIEETRMWKTSGRADAADIGAGGAVGAAAASSRPQARGRTAADRRRRGEGVKGSMGDTLQYIKYQRPGRRHP